MKLRYLITGTGRCGTVYMARLLTSVGIPCGHEAVFDWQGLDFALRRLGGEIPLECSNASMIRVQDGKCISLPEWVNPTDIVAESSYMAAPFLAEPILSGVPVIHVVRHPVKVINSFCNYLSYFEQSVPSNRYEEFIYRFVPEIKGLPSSFDRAAIFYVRWNTMIEEARPAVRFKIEDGPDVALNFIGKIGQPFFDDRTINSQKKSSRPFSLHLLQESVRLQVTEMGKRYGYVTDILF